MNADERTHCACRDVAVAEQDPGRRVVKIREDIDALLLDAETTGLFVPSVAENVVLLPCTIPCTIH